MASPAEVLYEIFHAESGQWETFVSFLPDRPDQAIVIYDTAGKLDGRIMATGEQVEHPGIQITVRALDHSTAWNKANDIALFISTVRNLVVTISSEDAYIVRNISRSGSILPLGVDVEGSRRRHSFSINAMLTISKEQ